MKQAKEAQEFAGNIVAEFTEDIARNTYIQDNKKSVLPQGRHTPFCDAPLVSNMEQDILPRESWMYGEIEQLVESADRNVRLVNLSVRAVRY